MKPGRPHITIRIARTAFGGMLTSIGFVGLFVPVMPGWLLIVPGLAILAGEYVWARRLLDGAKTRLDQFRRSEERKEKAA